MAPATAENVGAPATIASVIPVSAWITAGIGTSGSISVLHSWTRGAPPAASASTRTMPTSVIRSPAACVPVVSRSTKAKEGANRSMRGLGGAGA